ncbi:hypothetical protein H7F15_14815 [Pontibacter sp. Tf4]|uniref:hypothetical protein n=1 Tax=Pontibacter sp. Tf4 TaxID=2761620 RepID=UPI001625DFA1|nr:hypothetical protein [Pontibacter sp. Tf4]MBB6612320.1 hypothetical protein [Pontibacter sp. Tf4]
MRNLLLCLALLTFLVSCKTEQLVLTPTYNKGGYTFKVYKSMHLAAQDSVYVGGNVFDVASKGLLEGAVVKYGCAYADNKQGNFSFKTKPFSVGYSLVSRYIGCRDIETTPVVFQAGDSVHINFYVAQDDRPLIHCDN